MVSGIEIFKEHFKNHTDKFILIGGTACDIAMSQMGLDFRATKDLDIVLILEALDAEFSGCFWDFIKKGRYQRWENSIGEKKFYRFIKPANEQYPFMLELFSRKPDVLAIPHGCHLTPIPANDENSSLSAILLDEDYYRFIVSGKTTSDGLQLLSAEHLIPIKAKAYLDLSERKNNGHSIHSSDIKKHKNDVFRLFNILSPQSSVGLPESIAQDLGMFLSLMLLEPLNLKDLGIKTFSLQEVVDSLRKIYNLNK
jgi:hypothetical protein